MASSRTPFAPTPSKSESTALLARQSSTPLPNRKTDETPGGGEKSSFLDFSGSEFVLVNPDHGEGQFFGSAFNLASAAIGLGILSLPYTIHNSGLAMGGALFVLMAVVTVYSLNILICSAEMCKKRTYQDTVKETFGETISILTGGVIIWSGSGSTISSFTIVADLFSPIFKKGNLLNNRIFVMFLSLVVLFPLCYMRRINSLRHASGIAIGAFLYMSALVVISFFVEGETADDLLYVGLSEVDIARSIPIIVYAYTCHTQAIPVYAELRDRTSRAMFRVICGGVFLSFFLYFTTGIFGYLTFGREIQDNILKNYDPKKWEVLLGRILVCSAVLLGYPMSTWVMKDSFEQIYFYVQEKRALYRKFDVDDDLPLARMVTWRQNLLETIALLAISISIAILIPKINVVFGLVGSTCSVTLNFILPGLMYSKLLRRFPPKDPLAWSTRIHKAGPVVLVGFGIAIGILGTTTTIINLF
eukprot:Phypoly_transcript_07737.p1 GENE.Phypoly_transcript_07737~~Phypoly_transcript_07737.p1  ORF type:complete len:474 (+),score=61.35 Phypoly_transcript_07737:98-1519(+)